jgi:hypothetical protein
MTCSGALSNNQGTPSQWFDTSCFATPVAGVLGNAPRTPEVFGPGQFNLDWAMFKNFRITEGTKLQFRSEFFNVLNHTQFSVPATTFGTATFGKITSTAHSSRQVQFAFKFVF